MVSFPYNEADWWALYKMDMRLFGRAEGAMGFPYNSLSFLAVYARLYAEQEASRG